MKQVNSYRSVAVGLILAVSACSGGSSDIVDPQAFAPTSTATVASAASPSPTLQPTFPPPTLTATRTHTTRPIVATPTPSRTSQPTATGTATFAPAGDRYAVGAEGDRVYLVHESGEGIIAQIDQAGDVTKAVWNAASGESVVAFFGQDGFPDKIVIADHIVLFGNFSPSTSTVDIAVIDPGGHVEIFERIGVDFPSPPQIAALQVRSLAAWSPAQIRWASWGIKAASCALYAAATAHGLVFLGPSAVSACVSAVIGVAMYLDLDPVFNGTLGTFDALLGTRACLSGDPAACLTTYLDAYAFGTEYSETVIAARSGPVLTATNGLVANSLLSDDQIRELIAMGGIVHKGVYPPTINGNYFFNSCVRTVTNIHFDSRTTFVNASVRFTRQSPSLFIQYELESEITTGFSTDAIITGSGNQFSVFITESGTASAWSECPYSVEWEAVAIYSGTIRPEGIVDPSYAFIQTWKGPDPQPCLIAVGQGRVIGEGDGLAARVASCPHQGLSARFGVGEDASSASAVTR